MSNHSGARGRGRRRARLIASALAAALSLLHAGGARADEETIEELSLEDMLGVVERVTRFEQPVARAPAAVTIITADVTLDAIERIEVVRGPVSVVYGANASGGVVNVVRKGGVEAELRCSAASAHATAGYARAAYTLPGTGSTLAALQLAGWPALAEQESPYPAASRHEAHGYATLQSDY